MQELNQLKNLVIQGLESNGSLSNIRAQIRSSVFKVIDTQESNNPKKVSQFHWENLKVQKLAETSQGKEALSLVKELFQFYNMAESNNIFSSESNQKIQVKRPELINQFGLKGKADAEKPLLLTIFQESLKNIPAGKAGASAAPDASKNFMKDKDSKATEKVSPITPGVAPPKGKPSQPQPQPSKQEIQEQIMRNDSNKFGVQSQVFGSSQGYDQSVDSMKLQNFDHFQDVKK